MQWLLHSVGIFVLVCVLAGSVQAQTFNSLAAFRQPERLRQSGPSPGDCPPAPALPPIPIRPDPGSPRRPLAHRARIRAPADRTTPGTAGVARSGSGFRKARPVSCWPRFQERPGIEGSFIGKRNRASGEHGRPGYLPPCPGGRGHKYFAKVKAVKKEPEVLAKAKIQLGRSWPVYWAGTDPRV